MNNILKMIVRNMLAIFSGSILAMSMFFIVFSQAFVPVYIILILAGLSLFLAASQVLLLSINDNYSRLEILIRSAIFLLVVVISVGGLALLFNWLHNVFEFLILTAIIVVTYVVIWIGMYLRDVHELSAINKKLEEYNRDI
ncbi:DUF3021 family protein [Culicoidibacter larvae]|uniref:DUF3021 domain-containing protein n=1 Tax=Culicoidibacter larvae TaxID=2579976 RepID=A0A5R8QHK7_9FIRM|nr:DUF3021 family protein [Culicoidibacter larvae]TLG77216.1 DUF3021 domain-containing protein [Culicoidibacter larvae]